MRTAPSLEDYARMTAQARLKAAELAQRHLEALDRAEKRREQQQEVVAAERRALHDDAERHRLRALARWHDGPLLQRARLNEARAEMDHPRENRTAA